MANKITHHLQIHQTISICTRKTMCPPIFACMTKYSAIKTHSCISLCPYRESVTYFDELRDAPKRKQSYNTYFCKKTIRVWLSCLICYAHVPSWQSLRINPKSDNYLSTSGGLIYEKRSDIKLLKLQTLYVHLFYSEWSFELVEVTHRTQLLAWHILTANIAIHFQDLTKISH